MGSKMLKRFVLSAVSMCLALGQIHVTSVFADPIVNDVTDVDLVASQVDSSSDEFAVLNGGYIKPTMTIDYVRPADYNVSELISVDADNQIVTVQDFKDMHNNVWKPTVVKVIEDNYEDVEVEMTGNTGSFQDIRNGRTGNNYVISVQYTLTTTLSTELQNKIINVPHNLNTGVAMLQELYSYSGSLENLATTYITYLKMMVDGIYVEGLGNIELDVNDTVTRGAINALYKEINENSPKGLIVTDYINEYAEASAKQVFLVENAEALKAQLSDTQGKLNTIATSSSLQSFINTAETVANLKNDPEIIENVKNLKLLRTLIIDINNNVKSVLEEEKWGVLDYDYSDILTEKGKSKEFSDMLVEGLTTEEHSVSNETIVVDTAELVASVNRYKVAVSIELDAIALDDTTNTIKNLGTINKEVFGNDGADLAAIIDEVEKTNYATSDAFKSWEETYGLNLDNYEVSYYVDGNKVDSHELTGPINFTVKFTPKNTGSISSTSATELVATDLPYGYNVVLPKHSVANKSYNYTVEGNSMLEGSIYRVVGATTIERVEGKENKENGLFVILSNDTNYPFDSGIANAILTSTAVYDSKIQYPVLEQTDAESLVEFDGYVITAKSYPTQIPGMEWNPKSYTIGTTTTDFSEFDGEGNATAELATEAKNVQINYELKVIKADATDTEAAFKDKLFNAINLPNALIESTRSQINAIDRLANKISYLNMGSEIADGLTLFKSRIEESDRSAEDKAKLIDYANQLKAVCYTGKNLTIASYVQAYIDEGIVSFYKAGTFEVFKSQLQNLAKYLPDIAGTVEFEKLLSETAGLSQDQISGLDSTVEEIVNLAADFDSLAPRHDLINTADAGASTLLNAIVTAIKNGTSNVPSYSNANTGLTHRVSLTRAADGSSIVTIEVTFGSKTSGSIAVLNQLNGYELTAGDIALIEKTIKEESKKLNEDDRHYTFTYNLPNVGDVLDGNVTFNGEWTENTYTVKVPDMADATITYSAASFKLPAPEAGTRYIYNINGKKVTVLAGEALTYTVDLETEFDQLFPTPNAVFTVTRTEENISDANIITFVENLNNSLSTSGTKFTLVKNNSGEYAIVFNISADELTQVLGNAQNLILALRAGYPYIALGTSDNVLSEEKISIQALINAFAAEDGDFGMDTLLNGNIYDEIKGYDVIVGNTTGLGSMLLDSKIFLGNDGNAIEQQMPFYITVNMPNTVKDYLTKADPYMDINTKGDRFNLVVENMPNRPYQVLLATMLVTGYAKINDVTDVDFQGIVDYITSQSKEILLDENTTSETLQNTITELGLDYSLEAYADTIDSVLTNFRKIYNNSTFDTTARYNTNNEFVGYNSNISTDIAPVLNAAGVGADLFAMLAEYQGGKVNITLSGGYEINGIGQAYEAAIFDNSKSGTDKVWFSKDLSEENLGNNAVVVITGEITDIIEFTNNAFVDLNGQTVDEIRVSNGASVKVFDSSFKDGLVKAIRGNVKVTGGNYYSIAEDQIATGYELNGEVVESIFYSITTNDNDEIVLKLKPSFVNSVEAINQEALKYLAVDLALHGGMNFFTASSMTIDGNGIYAINQYEDLIEAIKGLDSKADLVNEVLGFIDCAGVTAFANELIEVLANFEAISGKDLGTYEIKTTAWNLDPTRADENYLTAGLIGGQEYTRTLKVELADDSMAELFAELAKVVNVPTGEGATFVKLESLSYDGGLKAVYDGGVKVEVDFTNNPEYTKLMGIILANQNDDLTESLKEYLEKGNKDGLASAINAMTIADVIAAIKEVSGKSYESLIEAAGISSVDETALADVERIYDIFANYIKATAKALTKLEITGPSRTLGSFDTDADYTYVADKENWHNLDGYVSIKPFADNYVPMSAELYIETSEDLIYGYSIDEANKVVDLDLHRDGISKADFNTFGIAWLHVFNGTIEEVEYSRNGDVISNGEEVTFIIKHDVTGEIEKITYTIRVLGDVNCNGIIENNDLLCMYNYYLDNTKYEEGSVELWAFDINRNDMYENNDTLKNQYKWLLGQADNNISYTSALENTHGKLGGNN